MQLDDTRIAIRERGIFRLLDMALRVVATHGGALLAAWAVGVVPAMLVNHWLLGGLLENAMLDEDPERFFYYFASSLCMVAWELPLATAGITLYLGQAMFDQGPRPGVLWTRFVKSLPQLLWYQVLLRGMWLVFPLLWFYPFAGRVYLNEVILLERNPFTRGENATSTGSRAAALHAYLWGEFFAQWMLVVCLGTLLFVSLFGSCWLLRGQLLGNWEFDWAMAAVCFPLSLWLVVGYFAVVRFLAYLDLRIRREGWELELLVRAEAARWKKALA